MNKHLAIIALMGILLISGCTTMVENAEQNQDLLMPEQITSDEVANDLDSVLIDESNDVEIGSII